jgi:antitoxin (DNA-binding transcriptional repressor) of toxin-antitoxin stability system
MTKTMTIDEAQTQLAELLVEAAAGHDIILTDGKALRVRLVPIAAAQAPRIAGLHAGSMTMTADFDLPLPDEFWAGAP